MATIDPERDGHWAAHVELGLAHFMWDGVSYRARCGVEMTTWAAGERVDIDGRPRCGMCVEMIEEERERATNR